MKAGDTCRVLKTPESIKLCEEWGLPETYPGRVIILSSPYTSKKGDKGWRDENGWLVDERCLVFVKEYKPVSHSRGLSLSALCTKAGCFVLSINPVPRLKELQQLHGQPFVRVTVESEMPNWFENMVAYTGVSFDSTTKLITKANGQSMKATKWVHAVGADEAKVQELATALDGKVFDLTLSTSYKDLVRCSTSKHFTSCWELKKVGQSITELLERPDLAIAVARDKSGDFTCRWIVKYWKEKNRYILFPMCYPFKDQVTKVESLAQVSIWNSRNAHTFPLYERFDSTLLQTEKLYDESYKSCGYINPISAVTTTGGLE